MNDGGWAPQVGLAALDWVAPNVHGAQVSLTRLRPALVVFVPFAFTPVCTQEVMALAAAAPAWRELGLQVVAISCDAIPTLRVWAEQHRVGFEVVSDFWPHGQIARSYGAFDERDGAADRVSVLVDGAGVVRWHTRAPRGKERSISDYAAAIEAMEMAP